MAQRDEPSYADLVYEVLQTAGQPLTFLEIFEEVNRRRPVTTRNPKATIRTTLGQGRQLISLGDGRYGYLPHLVQGSLLRQPLIGKGPGNHPLIYPDELRQALWPSFFESQKRRSTRAASMRMPNGVEVELFLEFSGHGVWGSPMPEGLRRYLVENRAAAGDSILIRVLDGEAGRCEGRFEPKRKRDMDAVSARNLELAGIAHQILRKSHGRDKSLWDLVIVLLGRGAYRADVAPDPLEEVLKANARFVYAGLQSWAVAESVTPEIQAIIDRRVRMESKLFSASSGAVGSFPEAPSPLSTRYAMERTLADVGAILEGRELSPVEEVRGLIQRMPGGGSPPPRGLDTPLQKAQKLIYDAWEEPNSRKRVQLVWRALNVSRDCADAYVLLAEETARSAEDTAELYSKGVAAGERALGERAFEEYAGQFWGVLETRPYMRARLGLAWSLWEMGKHHEAAGHIWEMLKLNPNDNQGLRYLLLSWLLEDGEDAQVKKLLDRYPHDVAGQWAYGRALHTFRIEGDTKRAGKLRAAGRKRNPYAPAYLLGRKKLPGELPDTIGFGDESEAMAIAEEQMAAWRKTPGALAWLEASRGRD